MKRIFSLIFTVMLVGQVWAATTFEIGNLKYTVTDETNHLVSVRQGSKAPKGLLEIPSEVTYPTILGTTYTVTCISDYAFQNCKDMTSITIPNSVTSIGDAAFRSCSGLTTVTIPNSVTSIGDAAFNSCSGLTTVTIPNSVTRIGNSVFSCCSILTEINVDINNAAYSSENGIMFNKDKTIIVRYPAGKTETEYIIPKSVRSIGRSAFYECSSLVSVIIPNTVTNIDAFAFTRCIGLKSVTIPNSVISICNDAFAECSSLMSITIPSSLTDVGDDAFDACCNATLYCECEETSKPLGWQPRWPTIWGCKVIRVKAIGGTASIDGTNYVAKSDDGSLWYSPETTNGTVTLNAITAAEGYHIDNVSWKEYISGDVVGIGSPLTLNVTESKTYTAIFEACTRTFKIENIISATCTTAGSKDSVIYCPGCHLVFSNYTLEIPALGHDWSTPTYEWADDGSACTATAVCQRDENHSVTEDATITSEETIAATCVEMGTTTYTATFENEPFTTQTKNVVDISATGHKADSIEIENIEAATCTTVGTYDSVVYCSICQAELFREEKEVPALGHTYSNKVTAPTCTAVGYTTHTCSVCKYAYNSDTIVAKGHKADSVEFENIVGATCTAAGSKDSVVYCTVCQAEVCRTKEDVAKLPHTEVTDAAVAATCTNAGKTEGKHCSVCNEILVAQTEIPALGHKFKDYVYNNDATTDADGTKTATCSRCGEKDTQVAEGTKLPEPKKGTAVSDVSANAVNIYAHGNTIVIENAAEEICVYNAMGALVERVDAVTTTPTNIKVNIPGVFIVKTGRTVKRVMINEQ